MVDNKKNKLKVRGILLCLMTIQVLFMICWGLRKEGYYIDELWSYGLANSYYTPFLQQVPDYMEQWKSPEFYETYLMVESNERFAWDSVYYNQTQDVHPPLYYMILHGICSVFCGSFSKWYGLGINIFCYLGTIWLLYGITCQCVKEEEKFCIIPSLCYGFCVGAVSEVMYIRMYMLLTSWVLLFVYLTNRFGEDMERRKKAGLMIEIALTTMAGFMTQYYFVIYIFFYVMAFAVVCLWNKKWITMMQYGISVLIGGLLGIMIFPTVLYQIFVGQKGQDSFDNMDITKKELLYRLERYTDILTKELIGINCEGIMYAGLAIAVFLFVACFLVVLLAFLNQKSNNYVRRFGKELQIDRLCMIGFAVSGYFGIVTVVSTDLADRYQFPIFPLIVLLLMTIVVAVLRNLKKDWIVWCTVGVYLILQICAYSKGMVNYIYPEYKNTLEVLNTSYTDVPGIYITKGDHLVINNCLFLASHDETYPLEKKDIEQLQQILNGKEKQKLILYVDIYYDEEKTAREVADILGYTTVTELYDNQFTKIFVLD